MSQVLAATAIFSLIGLTFALLLSFLNQKLKINENPLVNKVAGLLPGLNCGACGFSSCRAYAVAAIENLNNLKNCRPAGGQANNQIAALLGQKKGKLAPKEEIIICQCGAEKKDKKVSSDYRGLKNCLSAAINGGALDCPYGCFGFGDCQKACPSQAITIKNKKVFIDYQKCFLCQKCLQACPRALLKIIPKDALPAYFIACQNQDSAKETRAVCSRGCIACGICAKPNNSPYRIENNLSQINYLQKSQNQLLSDGKNKCPTKCIEIAINNFKPSCD